MKTAVTVFRGLGALFAIGVLLSAGCATTPRFSFYTLANGEVAALARLPELVLAVGPVDLPRYLDRPQIVTRGEGNRLRVDEFNRWGGSLEEEISRLLVGRLGRLLQSDRVYAYPSRISADTDYRIAIDIRSFDGLLGGEVLLEVAWSLIEDRTGEVLDTKQSHLAVDSGAAGYDAYVAAMSGLVTRLAAQLADRIIALPAIKKPAAVRRVN